MKNKFLIFLMMLFVSSFSGANASDPLKMIAIQENGRIKPFETFANESLELIYGKKSMNGRPSYEVLITWMMQPGLWDDKPIFELRLPELRESLKLPLEGKYVSAKDILSSDRLSLLFSELQSKREAKEKLDPFFRAVQRLESQLFTYKEVISGNILKFIPADQGSTWKGLPDFTEEEQKLFSDVISGFVGLMVESDQGSAANPLTEQQEVLQKAVTAFNQYVAQKNMTPEMQREFQKIKTEVHYNQMHPFRLAWISYLLGIVCIFLFWTLAKPKLFSAAWIFAAIGFLLHTYGFAIRVYLVERPPVSNMYETVVWVGYGSLIFAAILEKIYKWRFILFSGLVVAMLCLIVADSAPAVLDPSLQPLEAVLRSNYWLLIHVLTITVSYAAFFLAFILSDIGLIMILKGETVQGEKIKQIVLAIYRSMQIGVALLTPGIILGGVWADESWGRFWGWDPKEVWALIVLLGYLAILHARFTGWVKEFGMLVWGVVTFSLVLMAWYGVNFVLGEGLHSYGFGAGGVEYVGSFVVVHILFVLYVGVVKKSQIAAAAKPKK